MIKWIATFIGYSFFRFPGAILGFIVGGLIDQFFKPTTAWNQNRVQNQNTGLFQLNLLALAATVIKADGAVKTQELQFVRNFFITNYCPFLLSQYSPNPKYPLHLFLFPLVLYASFLHHILP